MEQSSIVQEFLELISISAPTKNERKMADVLKQKLAALGCEVYEDTAGDSIGGTSGNVIGILKGTQGKPLMLSAHMDRVPNGDNIKYLCTGEKITSDGTTILAADDVSGITAILNGIRMMKKSGKAHCDIEVVFTVCEERLAMGSKHLDYSLIHAKDCYCLDSPGHTGRIINSAPSKVQFFIDLFGKSAHAGQFPEKGVNALKAGAKILSDIREGRLDHETTANWAIMQAGTVTNVVCEHAQIGGEARSRSLEKLEKYIEYVKDHCEKSLSDSDATYKIRVEHCFDGFMIPAEDELIVTLCDAMKKIGVVPFTEAGGGGMDANRFNTRGIKSVGVATGYFNNHSAKEELYIEDLNNATKMVYELICAYSDK